MATTSHKDRSKLEVSELTPRYTLLDTTRRPVPKVRTRRVPFRKLDRTAQGPRILSQHSLAGTVSFDRQVIPKSREVEHGAQYPWEDPREDRSTALCLAGKPA